MKKLFILLILAGAYQGYTRFYHANGNSGFDADGNPQVLLFIDDGCGEPCDSAVRFLDHRKVDYETISVTGGEEQVKRWEVFGSVRTMPYLVAGNERVSGYNKWKFVAALAANFDNLYLTRSEDAIFQKNFTAEGDPKLVMYTMTGCGYCDMARSYLQQEGIAFEERNISVSHVAKAELDKFQYGTPLIFYGYRRFEGWGDHVRRDILGVL